MTITDLETQVLKNIATSDYGDGETLEERVNVPIWNWDATNEQKDLAGALSSCVKKGLCQVNGERGNDATVWITLEGVNYLKSINP